MKKLLATALCTLLLSSCSGTVEEVAIDVFNARQEATEAIQNLANEANEIKDGVGAKLEQIQQAAESVSEAVEAVNQAKEDISAITGGNEDENTEETTD